MVFERPGAMSGSGLLLKVHRTGTAEIDMDVDDLVGA
jgi:hypothetical protein